MTLLPTARDALQSLKIRPSDALDLLAKASYAVLVAVLHLIAGFLLLNAWMWTPEGPWDHSATRDVHALCAGVVVFELIAGAVTFAVTNKGYLRTWWRWLPPALLLVTAARAFFPQAG